MLGPQERLGVNLIHVFSTARSGSEPSVFSAHLEPTDCSPVAGSGGEDTRDRLTRELSVRDYVWTQRGERLFLSGRRCRVNSGIRGFAEAFGEFAISLTRRLACDRGYLGGEEREQDAIFIGSPRLPIEFNEAGTGALFATEHYVP